VGSYHVLFKVVCHFCQTNVLYPAVPFSIQHKNKLTLQEGLLNFREEDGFTAKYVE